MTRPITRDPLKMSTQDLLINTLHTPFYIKPFFNYQEYVASKSFPHKVFLGVILIPLFGDVEQNLGKIGTL